MAISAISTGFSGMRVASARLSASASNIANMDTTGGLPGTAAAVSNPVYRPVDVVSFDVKSGARSAGADYKIVQRPDGYFSAYDPGSPYADAEGMIAAPDVDIAAELVEGKQALQQFQASARIVEAINDAEKLLIDILA